MRWKYKNCYRNNLLGETMSVSYLKPITLVTLLNYIVTIPVLICYSYKGMCWVEGAQCICGFKPMLKTFVKPYIKLLSDLMRYAVSSKSVGHGKVNKIGI